MECVVDYLKGIYLSIYFLAADTLWISLIADPMYRSQLGSLIQMATGAPLLLGLVAAYGLLLLGLFYLALQPGFTIVHAGIVGLIIYGVYGFTNFLIMPVWSIQLVLADLFWGAFLYASSAAIAKLIQV